MPLHLQNMSTLQKIIHRWGFFNGLKLYSKIKSNPPEVWTLPELKYPVHLRKGTSDILIFKQIFGMGEYDIDFPDHPKMIIDGGANIGLFAVLMANRFPDAQIISIEPDAGNYLQLQKNTSYYPNIKTINAGIWNKDCDLQVKDEGYDEWGLQVMEAQPGATQTIKAIKLNAIIEEYQLGRLDVVKLDVEGAEAVIFKDSYEPWLSITNTLIIELHERNWPGISANFYKAINQYSFDSKQNGEYFIYTRKDLLT